MMNKAKLNETVADLHLTGTRNTEQSLTQLQGQNVVLYFYPKDSTPGCTQEGYDFHKLAPEFAKLQTVIFGISRDSLKSHEKFKETCGFSFELVSDSEEVLCNYFEVIKMKNMYGKQVRGIDRSTFLIDRQGILRKEWRSVKVDGHAQEVLDAVKQLD